MSAIQSNRQRKTQKNPCNFDQKIPIKILSHYPLVLPSKKFTILELYAKPFPTERRPSKCPAKEKTANEKQKKWGGERAKGKRRRGSACPNFKSCNLSSGTKASLVFDL